MNPPANWYPDPTGRHDQRYWDGTQWTEHVFTDGVQGIDPLGDATGSEATADQATDEELSEGPPDDVAGGVAPEGEVGEPAAEEPDQESDASAEPEPGAPGGEAPAPVGATTAPISETAPDAETDIWSPRGERDDHDAPEEQAPDTPGPDQDDEDVAPELAADDVVATLDEVTEPGSAEPDFSDAFVMAPETASRLVGRSARPAEDETAEPDQDAGETDEESARDRAAATTGAIDAPPPTMPGGAATPTATPQSGAGSGIGVTGALLSGAFAEDEDAGPVALQNTRLLRCTLGADRAVVARQGTMVAYQGDVSFERQGAGGIGRALKRAATGEGLAMMRVDGTGDVFFADGAQHVFLLELAGGPGLSANGRNLLAFDAGLQWDIERVKGANLLAGGLFNTTLTGSGWVALVSDGEPVVLRTEDAPTFVDVNALVAWTGGLQTRIVNTVSAKSLVGLGSGEAFQMAFEGDGVVIVQPSEGPTGGTAAAG